MELVEPRFQPFIRPIRLRNAELLVEVSSAAHRQELITFHAQRLLTSLNAGTDSTTRPRVRRIVFRPSS